MLSVISPWYEAKLFVEHATRIEHGTLHVVAGSLAWLVIAVLWRRPVSSWRPWLALLALILWNEFVDLAIEQWPHPGMQYGEGAKDLILTMLVPTVMMLVARWRPEIFAQRSSSGTADGSVGETGFPAQPPDLILPSEGARGMQDEPEQPALFQIEGPDEDGCVWACSPDGRDVWCRNLGPTDKVVEVMVQWLEDVDASERA